MGTRDSRQDMVDLATTLEECFGIARKNGAIFLAAGMVRIDGYAFREPRIARRRVHGRTLLVANHRDGAVLRGPVRPWGEPPIDDD